MAVTKSLSRSVIFQNLERLFLVLFLRLGKKHRSAAIYFRFAFVPNIATITASDKMAAAPAASTGASSPVFGWRFFLIIFRAAAPDPGS